MKTNRLNVLVVEDNPAYLEHIKSMFNPIQCAIHSIPEDSNIIESIARLKPDIVLASGINAANICREVKDNRDTAHIPVVLIGESENLHDKLHAFLAGAQKYLIKYQDEPELHQCINCLLRKQCKFASSEAILSTK